MISIAMAAYNGEKYIKEQLDSILSQTIQDFEIVVCDDCSKDSTLSILKEYEAKDSRIRVFANENNLGFVKNFEKALSLCKGDYIALSDQDDIWYPEHLEILLSKIGQCDMISANASFIEENGKPFPGSVHRKKTFSYSADQATLFFASLYRCNVQGAACMITRSLLEKALPIPEGTKYQDWYLSLVASSSGKGFCVIPEKVLHYRQHSSSCTPQRKKTMFGRIACNVANLFMNSDNVSSIREARINLLNPLLLREIDDVKKDVILKALWWHSSPRSPKKIFFFIKNYKKMFLYSRKSLVFLRDLLNLIFRNALLDF